MTTQINGQTVTKLKIGTGPYIKHPMTLPRIMRTVLYSTIPICAFSVYLFGLSSLLLILTTVIICAATEQFWSSVTKKGITINDGSAAVTGVLLALTLPPGFPLWMAGVAGFFAITFGKVFFGGLGSNIFNPALIGRAFIQSAFPVAITTWVPPFALHRFTETIPSTLTPLLSIPTPITDWLTAISVDGFTGATPLTLFKFQHIMSDPLAMATGFTSGSTGETCAILILLCGAYLCWKKIADWKIPASILLGAALTGAIFYLINAEAYPDPLFILTSGGLLFGAVFMATDPVGAPITPRGRIIFGLFIGFLVVIIRIFGSLPEGVMYAILWGNALSPTINRLTQLKPYGTKGGMK
ncbi:MAG: RnfABCDGE type electron transport complex subunit D [Candidatus Paceibacterota bacterium]|jgi:electron transport complex protein RnfD